MFVKGKVIWRAWIPSWNSRRLELLNIAELQTVCKTRYIVIIYYIWTTAACKGSWTNPVLKAVHTVLTGFEPTNAGRTGFKYFAVMKITLGQSLLSSLLQTWLVRKAFCSCVFVRMHCSWQQIVLLWLGMLLLKQYVYMQKLVVPRSGETLEPSSPASSVNDVFYRRRCLSRT